MPEEKRRIAMKKKLLNGIMIVALMVVSFASGILVERVRVFGMPTVEWSTTTPEPTKAAVTGTAEKPVALVLESSKTSIPTATKTFTPTPTLTTIPPTNTRAATATVTPLLDPTQTVSPTPILCALTYQQVKLDADTVFSSNQNGVTKFGQFLKGDQPFEQGKDQMVVVTIPRYTTNMHRPVVFVNKTGEAIPGTTNSLMAKAMEATTLLSIDGKGETPYTFKNISAMAIGPLTCGEYTIPYLDVAKAMLRGIGDPSEILVIWITDDGMKVQRPLPND